MVLPQRRQKNSGVELTSYLDLIGNAFFSQDLFKILGTSQSSVFVGETKEGFDTLVAAQGLQGAPAAPAWRPIAHPTIHGNVDLSANFPSGRPEKQSREKRDNSRHWNPSLT